MEHLSLREKGKQKREKAIVDAAERIFCRSGYEDAGMDEISKEAQFTKRTVYQYFESKEDLYFAVILRGYKDLYQGITAASKNQRSAYEQLEKMCQNFDHYYRKNPKLFRLMSYWGNIKTSGEWNSSFKTELIQCSKELLDQVETLILEGKRDGSVQSEIDSRQAACSLVFLLTGFMNQLAIVGDYFSNRFPVDQQEFSFFTFDLILKSLKKNKTSAMTRKGTV